MFIYSCALHLFDLCNHTSYSTNRTRSAGNNTVLCAFVCSEHDLLDCILEGVQHKNLGCIEKQVVQNKKQ